MKPKQMMRTYAITAILMVVLAVCLSMWLDKDDGQSAREQTPLERAAVQEDVRQEQAALLFRDSAMRHLAAVRTGAAARPDDDLTHDIVVLAGTNQPTFRDRADVDDLMPRLAALREAIDGLRPLDAPRVDCPIRVAKEDPRCTAYFRAMSALIDGGLL